MRNVASGLVAIGIIVHSAAALAMPDPVCGDVNKSGNVAVSDALLVLRKAVGVSVTLQCAPPSLPLQTGQTTSYGAGDDGDVRAGVVQAFVDNGDGTITDSKTGLMWEKKVQGTGGYNPCADETGNCANPHNADNVYSWSAGDCCSQTAYDGTVKTIFLNQLNNRCNNNTAVSCTTNADCSVPGGACGFAGHRDWRLPSQKELQGIVDIGRVDPALDPAFHGASCGVGCVDFTNPACSCDASSYYWSASTYANYPTFAWVVGTFFGNALAYGKADNGFVRAVRVGS